jgi:hypothetical protein
MTRRGSTPAGLFLVVAVLAGPSSGAAQQRPDSAFSPPLPRPVWVNGAGPVVLLDEAHVNFHTLDGRYFAFGRLLRRDGFVIRPNRLPFASETLAGAKLLVIANALADTSKWALPTRDAFAPEEVAAVERWVRDGGSLLLIADHMPFPGAAESLAAAFGVVFHNGFAFRLAPDTTGQIVFRRQDGSLGEGAITGGRSPEERVDSVASFTGQGFRLLRQAIPLLTLDSSVTLLLPSAAWEFTSSTPRVPAAGLLQGAAFRHGRGRVAVFGEAAMFSAQRAGAAGAPMGMNHPVAAQNPQFLLNVMHWLAGVIEPDPDQGSWPGWPG